MKIKKWYLFWFIILLLSFWIYLILSPTKFNKAKWISHPSERVEMIDHLLATYKLEGKKREEVVELLGAPDDNGHKKEINNIVYYLGDERGLISIDSEWLVISFDEEGKVERYLIYTD